MRFSSIDIFCHVIDNYGDAGVVYRFAKEWRVAKPDCRIRVFIDDAAALAELVPNFDAMKLLQELGGISYYRFNAIAPELIERIGTADVLIEAFACHIPEPVLEAASRRATVIINLEYFSAEPWIEGYHLKESLLGRGGLKKYFFMPGITKQSGGLIIGKNFETSSCTTPGDRYACLNTILKPYAFYLDPSEDPLVGTIFTYMRGFDTLLNDLHLIDKKVYLLVFGAKSAEGMRMTLTRLSGRPPTGAWASFGKTTVVFMRFVSQDRYDELLCASDFNIVRGEDSFARAILSGKPLLWHAYIQEKKYQLVKVRDFADRLRAYFDDSAIADHYGKTLMAFNDMEQEDPLLVTAERYDRFFLDLNKIGHATREMSYFIKANCNLIKNLRAFLDQV